jgi:hypothetical protein
MSVDSDPKFARQQSGTDSRYRTVSVSSDKEEKDLEKELEEELEEADLGRIMKMNAPEWGYIFVGCIAALISGGIQPAFAIVFAEILAVSAFYIFVSSSSDEIFCRLLLKWMKRKWRRMLRSTRSCFSLLVLWLRSRSLLWSV